MSVLADSQRGYEPEEFGKLLMAQLDQATQAESWDVRNAVSLLATTIGGMNERILDLERAIAEPKEGSAP